MEYLINKDTAQLLLEHVENFNENKKNEFLALIST